MGVTDTARYVHAAVHHIVIKSFAGFQKVIISCLCSNISHSGEEIQCPHGVTDNLILFSDGLMSLTIVIDLVRAFLLPVPPGCIHMFNFPVVVMGLAASFGHKVFRKPQVAFLACLLVEFYKGKFNLFMSGITRKLAFLPTEDRINVIRISAHDIKELPLSRCPVICNGGFHEMPGAV